MRRIFLVILAIAIVLVGAVIAATFLIPGEVYKQKIEEAAENALQRDVTLAGDVKLGIFPRIQATVGSAQIANPEGFGDQPFAEMSELRAVVKLWPLLSRRVEIDEFVLADPTIRLVQLEDGTNNWTFVTDEAATPDEKPADDQASKDFAATLGDVRLINGSVSYEDRAAGQTHDLKDLNIVIGMDDLTSPLSFKGDGVADDLPFSLDIKVGALQDIIENQPTSIDGSFTTDLLSASINGKMTLGEVVALDLDFDTNAPNITKLAGFAGVEDLPFAQALGALKASGHASGAMDNLTIKLDNFSHSEGMFSAKGAGTVKLTDVINTDLTLDIVAEDLQKLADVAEIELPAKSALGRASFSTAVTGVMDNLQFSNMKFSHKSDLLTIGFDGRAGLKLPEGGDPQLTFSGPFNIAAPRLRALATSAAVELPAGDTIYRSFSMSGAASGSLTQIKVSDAVVNFDDITGKGTMALDLTPDQPLSVTGNLTTGKIDATPYAVASGAVKEESQAKKSTGWENTPLELAFLNDVQVDVGLAIEALKFQVLDFGKTRARLTVENGVLVGNLEETNFYGGIGGAKVTARTKNGVPTFDVNLDIDNVSFQPFLGALAQLNLIQGDGQLKLSFTGQGATMADLMKTLSGSANVVIDDGAIQGIDLNKFQTLSLDSFVSGNWKSFLSQDASTEVKNFSSSFGIQNGVATSKGFVFKTDDLRIPGAIKLDIGGRNLGLSLTPTDPSGKKGLNGEFPPLTLTGPWGGGLKLGIDQSWVQTKLKAAAGDAIKNELGKQLGGSDLGKIVNGESGSMEDAAKNAAGDALRDALGIKTPKPTPTPTPTPANDNSTTDQDAAPEVEPAPEATPSPTPTETEMSDEERAKQKLKEELNKLFK